MRKRFLALLALGLVAVSGCGEASVERAPTAASAATPTATPPPRGRPSPDAVGVPAGWRPRETRSTDLVVDQPGAVVEDVLLRNANLVVTAENVTVRRVKLEGGRINNWPGGACANGLVIEDSTLAPPPGSRAGLDSEAAIGTGGYTARRVKIWRRSEGFRVGGRTAGCGPVAIEDSFAKISIPDGHCDLHADGVQGYDGDTLTLRRTTIDFAEAACGTAPFFMPDGQGNVSATIEDVLLIGGGYPFRLGVPASVRGLLIADRSWTYGPIDVTNCGALQTWDARIVTVGADYRIKGTGRAQPCA